MLVDIIVPCYNEEEGLDKFYSELKSVLNNIPKYSFRIIFINDGSKDTTQHVIDRLAAADNSVKYITFSRNFGKEAAMYAGLHNSEGDYVVIMDADLQHPPSLIPQMIEAMEKGYDCCAAKRVTRKGEPPLRAIFSKLFYGLEYRLSSINIESGATDYRMMTKQVVDAVKSLSENNRFTKGIFQWVGFDTCWIEYANIERSLGSTKWSFMQLFRYAIDGIVSFSTLPLRFASLMGMIISIISFIYMASILFSTLKHGRDLPGYASTIIIVMFIGGITILSVGILGEYIARIYLEVKNRPIFIQKSTNIKKFKEDERA